VKTLLIRYGSSSSLIFFSSVTDEFICLETQGLYVEAHVDVEVSSNEDVVSGLKPDVSAEKKASTNDDTRDKGVSLAKPNAPNLISSGAPKQSDPSIDGRVLTITPPAGGFGCKCPPPATKWNKLIL
jgi:hypothetical protein